MLLLKIISLHGLISVILIPLKQALGKPYLYILFLVDCREIILKKSFWKNVDQLGIQKAQTISIYNFE